MARPIATKDDAAIGHAFRDGVREGAEAYFEALNLARDTGRRLLPAIWLRALHEWVDRGGVIPDPVYAAVTRGESNA